DWELESVAPAAWDKGARTLLTNFLIRTTPYTADVPVEGALTEARLRRALTRMGSPACAGRAAELLADLSHAGYGWLTADGVTEELRRTADAWRGAPKIRTGFFV